MRNLFFMLFFAIFCLPAVAQSYDYYNNSSLECSLSGPETKWRVTEFKNGMSFNLPFIKQSADKYIIFSDDCVELQFQYFDDEGESKYVSFHFPVKEYKRISDDSFEIHRRGDDDYFNYILVAPMPNMKGKYRLLLALLEGGDMINTKIFNCEPIVYGYGKTINAARADKGKSVGMPVQVRKK